MKVLVLGSGGREHALGWKIAQSKALKRLYFAPGNAGTAELGINVPIDPLDFEELKTFAIETQLDMLVVGPEAPLVEGIYDFFAHDPLLQHVMLISPSKKAARLEGSKDFAKQFMKRHHIPTAAYQTFDIISYRGACAFIDSLHAPYVLKADGLAAGKGVLIINQAEEAKAELKKMMSGDRFGEASNRVVIEEFLKGTELSVFVLTDGKDYVMLPEAKDYKRIGDNDTGPNTGGMGTLSPVPFAKGSFMKKVEERIIKPTIEGIRREGMSYHGFLFFGLMNVNGEPYVIEYNVRMGDPETQSVLPRIKGDFLKLLSATARGELKGQKVRFDSRTVVTLVMASGGYPGAYEKDKVIEGLQEAQSDKTLVFHSGIKKDEQGRYLTNGGRVLSLSSFGKSMVDAKMYSYKAAKKIHFDGAYYRRDIGSDLIEKH